MVITLEMRSLAVPFLEFQPSNKQAGDEDFQEHTVWTVNHVLSRSIPLELSRSTLYIQEVWKYLQLKRMVVVCKI